MTAAADRSRVRLARRADIDLDAFRRVAWAGEGVTITPVALERIGDRRDPV